ncbi:hypothetical protein LJ737_23960 [Hymenobacter sp. 15J16-1T3B]|uniref:hypothetical protein n=1 Tax=Hymenobacter sp. 15J16-1T3B TaxID=2886941 RepID=UPI001D1187C0|nr:hypothetical protein [Hymenobacter sp. 15J16-1T3B]MCC3160314.1 hypothetical protein [Hymenobacter sp. 15J16-1T3B]
MLGSLGLPACRGRVQAGAELTAAELQRLRQLGLLAPGETVRLFDSQAGLRGSAQAGNFFTDRRLAAYWLEKDRPGRSSITYAYYPDVDTLYGIDRSQTLTYASYLEVRCHDGRRFNVYVSADSAQTRRFFRAATAEWQRARRPKP